MVAVGISLAFFKKIINLGDLYNEMASMKLKNLLPRVSKRFTLSKIRRTPFLSSIGDHFLPPAQR